MALRGNGADTVADASLDGVNESPSSVCHGRCPNYGTVTPDVFVHTKQVLEPVGQIDEHGCITVVDGATVTFVVIPAGELFS